MGVPILFVYLFCFVLFFENHNGNTIIDDKSSFLLILIFGCCCGGGCCHCSCSGYLQSQPFFLQFPHFFYIFPIPSPRPEENSPKLLLLAKQKSIFLRKKESLRLEI